MDVQPLEDLGTFPTDSRQVTNRPSDQETLFLISCESSESIWFCESADHPSEHTISTEANRNAEAEIGGDRSF